MVQGTDPLFPASNSLLWHVGFLSSSCRYNIFFLLQADLEREERRRALGGPDYDPHTGHGFFDALSSPSEENSRSEDMSSVQHHYPPSYMDQGGCSGPNSPDAATSPQPEVFDLEGDTSDTSPDNDVGMLKLKLKEVCVSGLWNIITIRVGVLVNKLPPPSRLDLQKSLTVIWPSLWKKSALISNLAGLKLNLAQPDPREIILTCTIIFHHSHCQISTIKVKPAWYYGNISLPRTSSTHSSAMISSGA